MIKGLHHIAIICSDRENSLHFYNTLGFTVGKCCPRPEQHDEIILLGGFGITLELFIDATHPARVTNPEAMGLRHLALWTDNIDELIETLVISGYQPEPLRRDTFTCEKMTFVKDPDGLPIELHE